MQTKVIYQTSARATGGRDGQSGTLDGSINLKMTTPKEFGGPGGDGNNPEQLFATGYAACFLSALKHVSLVDKNRIPDDSTVTATVAIGPNEVGGFELTVALEASIPGFDPALAEALVAKAHTVCPYSNATKGNIDVKLSVVTP